MAKQKTLYQIIQIIIILVILLSYVRSNAQKTIKQYVQESSTRIATIEPDSTNYEDLEAIGNAIGDSKVVMLGEQDHGDAPTFLAKTRLIKYLHEKKGFNVLAFESDFLGLNEGWDKLNKTKPAIELFLRENVYPVWTRCNTCNNLFYDYIPESFKTVNPLQLTGFDSQVFLQYSSKNLVIQLDSLIKHWKLPIQEQPEYPTILTSIKALENFNKLPADSNVYNQLNNNLLQIKKELGEKLVPTDFWIQVMDNLIQENQQWKYRDKDQWKSYAARDLQMARNLKWLSEVKYQHEKIIVWAHNYHVSKFNGHYPESFLNNMVTMGAVFTQENFTKDKTYILGFTSYEGTAGRIFWKKYKIEKPRSNTFETWIDPKLDYVFVDFKKYNLLNPSLNESFYMSGSIKGNEQHTNHQAQWSKIFDGVFYIKRMYPCDQ